MMRISRQTSRPSRSPRGFHRPRPPRPYTPTPYGFERCLRAWVGLPPDDVPTPDAGGARAAPEAPGVRDHTGRMPPTKGHRRRRGRGPEA
jgi:hypothetical protein